MDAASLVKLAAAKGIDLTHVAGVASDLTGIARERRLTAAERKRRNEDKLSLEIQETVVARESRTYRRPAWSHGELGMAAKGLGVVPWCAALYSYAGAKDCYLVLLSALRAESIRLSRREHWPVRVPTEDGRMQFYCEQLAQLVLDEDALKHLFAAAPQLYAIYMGVTPPIWDKQLYDPYRSLKTVYEQWLGMARGVIARWICEPDRAAPLDDTIACG